MYDLDVHMFDYNTERKEEVKSVLKELGFDTEMDAQSSPVRYFSMGYKYTSDHPNDVTLEPWARKIWDANDGFCELSFRVWLKDDGEHSDTDVLISYEYKEDDYEVMMPLGEKYVHQMENSTNIFKEEKNNGSNTFPKG